MDLPFDLDVPDNDLPVDDLLGDPVVVASTIVTGSYCDFSLGLAACDTLRRNFKLYILEASSSRTFAKVAVNFVCRRLVLQVSPVQA